jgi:hypothetical protein
MVLLFGIVDKSVIKRLKWKEGRAWALFSQSSLLVTYVSNLLMDYSRSPLGGNVHWLMMVLSLSWFALSCSLALLVNFEFLLEQYRNWQNRNGSFELRNMPNATVPQQPAPNTIGAAAQAPVANGPAAAADVV